MTKVRFGACLALLCAALTAFAQPDVPLVPVPPPPLGVPTTATPRVLPAMTTKRLFTAARERMTTFDSYIVRLSRREAIKGVMQPDEILLVRFRARPWSVYFKWLGKEGQGREVAYTKGKYGDKIHSVLAAGDVPFMPAGRRMALSPDNVLVRGACRHPITEAGLAASVERIGRLITDAERDPRTHGKVSLLGPTNRGEFEKPVWGLEHALPAGLDPTLPRGGKRSYYFHPDSQLPMLITAYDETGAEVEYYRYDRLQPGVKLDDDDFDPDRLWGKSGTTTASR
jgi:hypothetical protein